MKKLSFLIPVFFVTSLAFSQTQFEKGTLAEALEKAKSTNRILMVDVLTDWCKWCIELDNKVYADADVSGFANANQINFKIDAEKGEGIEFAKKYKITGYPTVLFLDGSGSEVDRIYGYVPKQDFFAMMQDYNKGINTLGFLKKALEKNPDDLDANLKMADKYISLGENEEARKYLNKIIAKDPGNAAGKTDDAKFKLASIAQDKDAVRELENFVKDNPESDVLKDACQTLAEKYYENTDFENADKCYNELLIKYPEDEGIRSSYGQFLNYRALTLADKGKGTEDYNQGLKLIEQALPYVKGSVNEASSNYIQSKLYFNLKQYDLALESVNRALKIFDRKLYRDHKDKIEKAMK